MLQAVLLLSCFSSGTIAGTKSKKAKLAKLEASKANLEASKAILEAKKQSIGGLFDGLASILQDLHLSAEEVKLLSNVLSQRLLKLPLETLLDGRAEVLYPVYGETEVIPVVDMLRLLVPEFSDMTVFEALKALPRQQGKRYLMINTTTSTTFSAALVSVLILLLTGMCCIICVPCSCNYFRRRDRKRNRSSSSGASGALPFLWITLRAIVRHAALWVYELYDIFVVFPLQGLASVLQIMLVKPLSSLYEVVEKTREEQNLKLQRELLEQAEKKASSDPVKASNVQQNAGSVPSTLRRRQKDRRKEEPFLRSVSQAVSSSTILNAEAEVQEAPEEEPFPQSVSQAASSSTILGAEPEVHEAPETGALPIEVDVDTAADIYSASKTNLEEDLAPPVKQLSDKQKEPEPTDSDWHCVQRDQVKSKQPTSKGSRAAKAKQIPAKVMPH